MTAGRTCAKRSILCKQRQRARHVRGDQESFGPSVSKIHPLKSKAGETITDPAEQMKRWALPGPLRTLSQNCPQWDPCFAPHGRAGLTPSTDEELSKPSHRLICPWPSIGERRHPSWSNSVWETGATQPPPVCQSWDDRLVPQDVRDASIRYHAVPEQGNPQ